MTNNNPSLLRRYRAGLRLALDRLIDRRWNIDSLAGTSALSEKTGKFQDSTQNVPLNYYVLYRFFRGTPFGANDVFYDIGCGNGRVLCYVGRKRISKVIGIELSPAFADRAKANAQTLRHRLSPIEVRCGDAAEMDYSDGTIFFFANPFGPKTLQSVLDNIQQTTVSRPRSIYFMYYNPVHASVFQSCGWLKHSGRREAVLSRKHMELWKFEAGNQ